MITVSDIKQVLPHRYPMLLIDRVLELEPGVRLIALKAVTCNEPWYAGLPEHAGDEEHHYPPSLLVESWSQAAAVLAMWDAANPDALSGRVVMVGHISDITFRSPVLPGDVLQHRVRLVHALHDTMVLEGESMLGDEVVVQIGALILALRPANELVGTAAIRSTS